MRRGCAHPARTPALAGIVFLICAGIAFANPESTFKGLADILGFLFLTVLHAAGVRRHVGADEGHHGHGARLPAAQSQRGMTAPRARVT
jgi:hypothetical protein